VVREENGLWRVTSGAFQPHRESLSISVTLVQLVVGQLGKEAQRLALLGHENTHGLCVFNVGDAREIGFMVRGVPVEGNPAHGMLFAQHPDTGEVPSKNKCKAFGRLLSKVSEVVRVPPPDG